MVEFAGYNKFVENTMPCIESFLQILHLTQKKRNKELKMVGGKILTFFLINISLT